MKKHMIVTMVAVSMFLTACGNNKTETNRPTPAPAPAPAPTPNGEKPKAGELTLPEGENRPNGIRDDAPEINGPRPPIKPPRSEERNEEDDQEREDRPAKPQRPQTPAKPQQPSRPLTPVKPQQPQQPSTPQRGEIPPRPINQNDVQWAPPALYGTPANYWLQALTNPTLSTLAHADPRPRSLSKRQRITLALGYLDGYHTKALTYEGDNYGRVAAVDPFLYSVVESIVQRPCTGNLQLCGFDRIRTDSVETVFEKIGYDDIIIELRVFSGAYGIRYDENVGARADLQRKRSLRAEALFTQSFEDSDLVVYVGHSRMGGGPDFRPPRLNRAGTVDYPAYKNDQSGKRRVIDALKSPRLRAKAVAILSCDSEAHFVRDLRAASPRTQLALVESKEMLSEHLLNAGIASMDLYLRQGHLSGLQNFSRALPKVGPFLTLSAPRRGN